MNNRIHFLLCMRDGLLKEMDYLRKRIDQIHKEVIDIQLQIPPMWEISDEPDKS